MKRDLRRPDLSADCDSGEERLKGGNEDIAASWGVKPTTEAHGVTRNDTKIVTL